MLKIFSLSMLPRKQQSLLVTFVFLFNACTSDSSSTPDGAITETDAKPDGAITETDAISSDIINIANPGTLVVETDNLIPHFQSCLNIVYQRAALKCIYPFQNHYSSLKKDFQLCLDLTILCYQNNHFHKLYFRVYQSREFPCIL